MDLVQFIGYVISFLALLYLFSAEKRRPPMPPAVPHSQDKVKDELHQKKVKSEESGNSLSHRHRHKNPPSKKPVTLEKGERKAEMHPPFQSMSTQHHIEKVSQRIDRYAFLDHEPKNETTKASKIVEGLRHRRNIIIYHEIIDKPISLRPPFYL